jgi:hypothetical protein
MPRDDDRDLTPLGRVMRSHKRRAKLIPFPGLKGTDVNIVCPSDEEIAEAQAAATQYLKATLRLDEFQLSLALERNLYEAEEERQILARCLRDPIDSDASFGTVDELREILTPDMRKSLMKALGRFQDEEHPEPQPKDRTPEALSEFIDALKGEGALSEYLTSCDSDTARSIALSLAEALPKRQAPSSTDTSSSNSPSDSGSA